MIKTPYTLDVYDLMHRPGEMRERALDITVPETLGNPVIGIPAGAKLHADVRLESLHDGILVSAEVDADAVGECVRCLIEVTEPVQVEFQELFAYSEDEAFEYEVHEDTIDLEPVIRGRGGAVTPVPAGLSRRLPRPVPAVWGCGSSTTRVTSTSSPSIRGGRHWAAWPASKD